MRGGLINVALGLELASGETIGAETTGAAKRVAGSVFSQDWNSGVKLMLSTWPITEVILKSAGLPWKVPSNSCTSRV